MATEMGIEKVQNGYIVKTGTRMWIYRNLGDALGTIAEQMEGPCRTVIIDWIEPEELMAHVDPAEFYEDD